MVTDRLRIALLISLTLQTDVLDMVSSYNSLQAFTDAIQALDATAEVYQPLSISDAYSLLETPPAGKLIAGIEGGVVNGLTLVFNASGTAVHFKRKGSHYLLSDSAAPSPTKAAPYEVRTLTSPKELELYLQQFAPGCTVNTYFDSVPDGWDFITASRGLITTVTGAPSQLISLLSKGAHYTVIT